MKRRDFLKLIGIAPIAPSVLVAMPKKNETKTIEYTFGVDMATEVGQSYYVFYISNPSGKDNFYQVWCKNEAQRGQMMEYTGFWKDGISIVKSIDMNKYYKC